MKKDSDIYQEKQEKVKEALDIWDKQLGQKRQTFVPELKKMNPKLKVSTSTLSKIYQKSEEPSEGNLVQIDRVLDLVMKNYSYEYNPEQKSYQGNANAETSVENPAASELGNIARIYESYHLSKVGKTILRTIIRIRGDGKAEMWNDSTSYEGEAKIFKGNLLSIRFDSAKNRQEKYPFFVQLICHIGNYWQLMSSKIQHFSGICATVVSMDNEPMAVRRVLIKVADVAANPSDFEAAIIFWTAKPLKNLTTNIRIWENFWLILTKMYCFLLLR